MVKTDRAALKMASRVFSPLVNGLFFVLTAKACVLAVKFDGFVKSFLPRRGVFAASNLREVWFFTANCAE
ncbi:MAG: hypothetical protein SWH68_11605 [Thermodesulfobacteriota bacterium]|nr:hypothetical protein [Thermodesulfobacteriota bacterium]